MKSYANKLIVGLGHCLAPGEAASRASLGRCVVEHLLHNCNVPPADVHDARSSHRRSNSRDEKGFNRRRTFQCGGMKRTAAREQWDTAPFMDYDAVWCDRLLLGDDAPQQQQRCAVLLPYGALADNAASLHLVLHSQPQLCDPRRILLVAPTPHLAGGNIHVGIVADESTDRLLAGDGGSVTACLAQLDKMTVNANQAAVRDDALLATSVMWIGTGADFPFLRPLSAAERTYYFTEVIPVAAFACALWTTNPDKAVEFVHQKKWLRWSGEQRQRVTKSMQSAMLSTRDERILDAYKEGTPVSMRMSQRQTIYEAHKVLDRLEERKQEAQK